MAMMNEEGRQQVKWIKHYCSSHDILLVGEGDFSFSLCLAMCFGSANNIVASSLDSYDELITKYKNARSNLQILENLGASLLHGVDATKLKFHSDLRWRKFDRIIFNFPHAGFYGKEDNNHLIMMHRHLVREFFRNACGMLKFNGEIHVSHKTTAPFDKWKIQDLASHYSLLLIKQADFRTEDYPGYNNKRGAGTRCDDPFPLRQCSTFKFILHPHPKRMLGIEKKSEIVPGTSQKFQYISGYKQQPPVSFYQQRPHCPVIGIYDLPLYAEIPSRVKTRSECIRVFSKYLNEMEETFGRTCPDFYGSVRDALGIALMNFMSENPSRPLSDCIDILEELHHFSIWRSERLREMLRSVLEDRMGIEKLAFC